MKSMKGLSMNKMLGSIKKKAGGKQVPAVVSTSRPPRAAFDACCAYPSVCAACGPATQHNLVFTSEDRRGAAGLTWSFLRELKRSPGVGCDTR